MNDKTKKALQNKSSKSGVAYNKVAAIYRRGLAAWKSGHRPGVSQHQWAMARVNSALTGGKAATSDKDILKGNKKVKNK